jgi:hypothetical protein
VGRLWSVTLSHVSSSSYDTHAVCGVWMGVGPLRIRIPFVGYSYSFVNPMNLHIHGDCWYLACVHDCSHTRSGTSPDVHDGWYLP